VRGVKALTVAWLFRSPTSRVDKHDIDQWPVCLLCSNHAHLTSTKHDSQQHISTCLLHLLYMCVKHNQGDL
jgi:hypothetical protein